MFRVPGINFRNLLLCLAITLQLLTFLKHNGSVVVGFPSVPVPNFGSEPESQKSATAGGTGAGWSANVSPAAVSTSTEPAEHPIAAPTERTHGPGGPSLQPATPRGGASGGGAPSAGSPGAPLSSPEPAVTNLAPPDSGSQEPVDPGSSEGAGDDGSEATAGGDPETPTETGEDEIPIE